MWYECFECYMNVATYECECISPLNWWFWQFDKMTKGSEVFSKIIILNFQGIKWLKVRKYHTLTYPFKNGWELCTCGCKILFIVFFTWLWKWWMESKKWIFYCCCICCKIYCWIFYWMFRICCWMQLKMYKAWNVYKIKNLHSPPSLIYWLVLKSFTSKTEK